MIYIIRLKRNPHQSLHELISKDLVVDDSRTRRFVTEIGCYEKYRYEQLQNRELKSELQQVNHEKIFVLMMIFYCF